MTYCERMATGGAVKTRPHDVSQSEFTTDQQGQNEPQYQHTPMCRRIGCDRAATLIWTEQTTGGQIAYCAEDGVEAFNLVTRWLGVPEQRINLEEHAIAVEKAIGRGLYDQPPRYRPVYDGDDTKTKRL